MRKFLVLAVFAIFVMPIFAQGLQWLPNRFIIHFYSDFDISFTTGQDGIVHCGIAEIDSLMETYEATGAKRIMPLATNPKIARLRYPIRNMFVIFANVDSARIPDICEDFKNSRYVQDASPDYFFPEDVIPNDPRYSSQWHLEKVNMPDVWEYITDANDVLVTVLEQVEWYHQDLYDNIWVNSGEDLDSDGVPMDPDDLNGVDDDGNGYVDDLIGWDFVFDDNDPDASAEFESDHGTMCSGIIAAVGNNNEGVSGVVWHTKIVCLSSDSAGGHIQSAIVAAMQYGMENGVDIYSLSYGGYSSSAPARLYYQVAHDNYNAILVGAAGNESVSDISFPAGYSFVLAVGSTNEMDRISWFSNYGTWVDVMAPGENILTTTVDSTYESVDGTSMSAPVVAGIAALMRHSFPDSSNDFIYEKIREGTDNIDSLNPGYEGMLGTGRVNAAKALYQWRFPFMVLDSFKVIDADGNGRVTPGESAELYVFYHNEPGWQTAENLRLFVSTDDTLIDFTADNVEIGDIGPGEQGNNLSEPATFHAADEFFTGRDVKFRLRVFSSSMGYSKTEYITVRISYAPIFVYECDGENMFSSFLNATLSDGKVIYDDWVRDSMGIFDDDILNQYVRTLFVIGGNDSTNILSDSEIDMLENFMDNGGNVILSGQYYTDSLAVSHPDFLQNYFGAQHDEDNVNRMWGLYVVGVDDDSISDGMMLKCITNSDAANNQFSFGTAYPTGTGIGFLRYQSDSIDTRYAGIRNTLASGGKSILLEFGIEGVCNGVAGFTYRDSLVARMLRWMGEEYTEIGEPKPAKPNRIKITASPNPFNSSVRIEFNADGKYSVDIYDFSGKLVKSFGTNYGQGRVSVEWNGKNNHGQQVATGMYLVEIRSLGKTAVSKIVFVK